MTTAKQMTETEKSEAIAAGLKAAAAKALMIDPDDALKLVDISKLTLEPDGSVKGADESIAELKKAKLHLFGKHARDMSESERAAKLKELSREPKPLPMPTDKTAQQMTPREREAFWREVSRRFG